MPRNVDVRNFEVISVDGNKLVVRDERGTQELTVPDDFRFTVDGKKMSVSELKAECVNDFETPRLRN
jgi:hypothetical protein